MDKGKHLVYNFGGEEVEDVADDDFPERSTHSIPTGTIYLVLNIDDIP